VVNVKVVFKASSCFYFSWRISSSTWWDPTIFFYLPIVTLFLLRLRSPETGLCCTKTLLLRKLEILVHATSSRSNRSFCCRFLVLHHRILVEIHLMSCFPLSSIIYCVEHLLLFPWSCDFISWRKLKFNFALAELKWLLKVFRLILLFLGSSFRSEFAH
jgi:hypothetical protein